jgi:hypothetical protein
MWVLYGACRVLIDLLMCFGAEWQIDFFALTYFRWKPQNWGQRVRAFVVPRCQPGKYVDMPL